MPWSYLFHRLAEEGREDYEGYFVFDADNLVDPAFTAEMNRVFDTGKYGAHYLLPQLQEFWKQLDFGGLLHLVPARGPVPQFSPDAAGLQLPRVRAPAFLDLRRCDPPEWRLALHLLTEDIDSP